MSFLKSIENGDFRSKEVIQSLWSGYGSISRYEIGDRSVVVKHVNAGDAESHPRGWSTLIGHKRKLSSYQNELSFYQNFCGVGPRRPELLESIVLSDSEMFLVLEDLDSSGFRVRKSQVSSKELENVIVWLAQFHAAFLNLDRTALWPVGSYWHLDTRPEEYDVMVPGALKDSAKIIDAKLKSASFKTLLHGDAKLANYCFSRKGEVAGVDFQYVGSGVGLIDLMYLLGSCLSSNELFELEKWALSTYFTTMKEASKLDTTSMEALEDEWRKLYPLIWADFSRFLEGWMPGHQKLNRYAENKVKECLELLS